MGYGIWFIGFNFKFKMFELYVCLILDIYLKVWGKFGG